MTVMEEGVKKSVKKTVFISVLETLGDVAETSAGLMHEALEIGIDFLDLAPVPGLAPAARLVLNMWNAIEDTDVNDIRCLRLTERCAIMLNSVRNDIKNSGDTISRDMASALTRLEDAYTEVGDFLNKFKEMHSWTKILNSEDDSSQYPEKDVDMPEDIYSDLMAIFDSQYQTDTMLNDAVLDELEKELEA